MNYRIVYPDELYHHGVKGMKWGVKRKQDSSGKLTDHGYAKYYTNGKLNRKGRKAQKQAQNIRDFGGAGKTYRSIGYGSMAIGAQGSILGSKVASHLIHVHGNVTITKMKANGASFSKRKAVAGAHIAAMGAVTAASIYPYAKRTYQDIRYRHDSGYANRVNAMADLSPYEKNQRKKK